MLTADLNEKAGGTSKLKWKMRKPKLRVVSAGPD